MRARRTQRFTTRWNELVRVE
ncbi:MAG: hypothetical protein DCF17_00390 [Shackletoniella antarctica]|uniref:DUF4113 domain-containing protein n=1 Tax=Shackletoniella antarctica TaxID=268115 RepID=A0A2W4YGY8_9CYAN|nr:MAG: hypothetical protein DCF17_00390 [Shackletoniella antarctica]